MVLSLVISGSAVYAALTANERLRRSRKAMIMLTAVVLANGFSLFVTGFILGSRYEVGPDGPT